MSYKLFCTLERVPHDGKANISKFYNSLMFLNFEYILTWFGKIILLPATNQLMVEAYFCSAINEFYIKTTVPLEYTIKMPIGSIWLDGISNEKLVISEEATVLFKMRDVDTKNSIDTNIIYDNPVNNDSKIKTILSQNYHNTKNNNQPEFRDANTLILVPCQHSENANESDTPACQTIVIHPLQFLNAHYGVSKSIPTKILCNTWDKQDNKDISSVTSLLHLDEYNENCPQAVYISNDLAIGDAVFIHYLRSNDKSLKLVQKFHSRIRKSFNAHLAENKGAYSYLKVTPYHTQPITLECRYIRLDKNTLLCTEIIGISMPQGEAIYYDLEGAKITDLNGLGNNSDYVRQVMMPIYRSIKDEQLYLDTGTPNNRNKGVIRQPIKTIGEIRQLIRNDTINIVQAVQKGEVVSLEEKIPERHAVGRRVGANGDVGVLQVLISEANLYQKDSFGVCEIDSQYEKLLKYAQYIKIHPRTYGYKDVQIDCYVINEGLKGEVIKSIGLNTLSSRQFPYSVYILRLELTIQTKANNDLFYFLDCEATDKNSSSGTVIKVDVNHETEFLGKNYEYNLEKLVRELRHNQGRLNPKTFNSLKKKENKDKNGQASGNFIEAARYNHVKDDSSNWIVTGIRKF